jgi:hypothetical protein
MPTIKKPMMKLKENSMRPLKNTKNIYMEIGIKMGARLSVDLLQEERACCRADI